MLPKWLHRRFFKLFLRLLLRKFVIFLVSLGSWRLKVFFSLVLSYLTPRKERTKCNFWISEFIFNASKLLLFKNFNCIDLSVDFFIKSYFSQLLFVLNLLYHFIISKIECITYSYDTRGTLMLRAMNKC